MRGLKDKFKDAVAHARQIRIRFNVAATTSTQILKQDFGDCPPKPLQPKNVAEKPVEMRHFFARLGRAEVKEFLDLYMSEMPEELKGDMPAWMMKSILSAEIIKERLREFFGVIFDSRGFMVTGQKERIIYFNPFLTTDIADTISHENIHLLQNDADIAGELSALDDLILGPIFARAACPADMEERYYEYLSGEEEMQVSLHRVVAELYKVSGRLPTTKKELLATLWSVCDLVPSEELCEKLMKDPDWDEIYDLSMAMGFPESVPSDFYSASFDENVWNIAEPLGALEGTPLEFQFWTKSLPALYANLLSLYGDKEMAATVNASAVFEKTAPSFRNRLREFHMS